MKQITIELPDKRNVTIEAEESMTLKDLADNLKDNGLIDQSKTYILELQSGSVFNETDILKQINENNLKIRDSSGNPSVLTNPVTLSGTPIIPRVSHQLGILVLDGSGSMSDKTSMNSSKAKEVNAAVIELFNRMNVSRVKQNFSFACIKFDNAASISLPPIAFDYNQLMREDYNPMEKKGGGTHIFEALAAAQKMAEDFLNNAPAGGVPHKVLILLMSDGLCFQPQTTISVASNLKSNPKIQIACAYFGTIGANDVDAQKMLKEISTDPAIFYTTVYDGEALRAFFQRSISQSSGIKLE